MDEKKLTRWDSIPNPVYSQCNTCKHLDKKAVMEKNIMVCTAYPEGIPKWLVANKYDHKKPFEGDHGIMWEPEE